MRFIITSVAITCCIAGMMSQGPDAVADDVHITANGDRRAPQAIHWLSRGSAAATAAEQSQKPVLIYFSSARCGYCRKMEHETWSQRNVITAVNSEFVPLHLSAATAPTLVRRFQVRAYPTTIVLSPQGTRLLEVKGYRSPRRVLEMLEQLQRKQRILQNAPAGEANIRVTGDTIMQP